ncbi:MAG: PspC domain-containing protein [Propionibacteriaceae bacterium]|nr:PspC domain-containing protein [Propionibacteriaceae bacterium]
MEPLTELRRNTTDRRVAGVCVMLADRWRVDPMLVRVAAVLLALSSGLGLVVYAAAWAMIPPEGADRAPIDSVLPGVRKLGLKAGIALLIIAILFFASLVGQVVPFGFGPALVIGAVWYLGWYRPERRRRDALPKPAAPPRLADRPFTEQTPFTEAASAWQQRMQAYLALQAGPAHPAPPTTTDRDPGYSLPAYLAHPDPVGLYQTAPEPPPAPLQAAPSTQPTRDTVSAADSAGDTETTGATPAPVKPVRRRTWRIQLIGWAVALIAFGAVAWVDQSRDLPLYAYLAALLLAVGFTMVLGAWFGRPRGLVVAGALLGILIGGAAAPLPETPVTTASYATVADLPSREIHPNGERIVDLSTIALNSDAQYDTGIDLGKLTIIVPADANVHVVWAVEAGDARVLDLHLSQGFDLDGSTVSHGPNPTGPTLTIRAQVGLGQLEVKR